MDPLPSLTLHVLPGRYAIAQPASWPDWLPATGLVSVTRTAHEFSVICEEGAVPAGVESMKVEAGWAALELEGPFPFHLTGILHAVLQPLAQAKIGIFALSTYDTDYVLVKAADLDRATATLTEAGHRITRKK